MSAALPTPSLEETRWISQRARRPRADSCFALAEQASEEAGLAHLVLVQGGCHEANGRATEITRKRKRANAARGATVQTFRPYLAMRGERHIVSSNRGQKPRVSLPQGLS